jgi:hypothetical protein
MTATLQEILRELSAASPFYVDKDPPKAFHGGIVRAIFLGADPGTLEGRTFKYVFSLENGASSPYFRQFLPGLQAIGLSLDDLYVQNLCQNYFKVETQRHRTDWLACAKRWIPYLRDELDSIDSSRSLPVLVSAYVILEALNVGDCKPAEFYYRNRILIRKNQNHLHRTLLPFFRGGRGAYRLDKTEWSEYASKIARYVRER